MTKQVHGVATKANVLVDWYDGYTVYTTLPIKATGVYTDESQKNFNIVVSGIEFRTLLSSLVEPDFVLDLSSAGAPSLVGPGYVFKFGVETKNAFDNRSKGTPGPVGLLIDDLDGLMVVNDTVRTKGDDINTEFLKNENIGNKPNKY